MGQSFNRRYQDARKNRRKKVRQARLLAKRTGHKQPAVVSHGRFGKSNKKLKQEATKQKNLIGDERNLKGEKNEENSRNTGNHTTSTSEASLDVPMAVA